MSITSQQLIQDRIEKLRENTDFVSTLFESLVGYAIIAADFDGNVITFNEGARQMYGYAPEEIIGQQSIDIFFPRDFIEAGELRQIVRELIEKGRFSCEGEKVRKNGKRFPAQILFTLTKDKSGKVVGFVEIVQDLTERKRMEEMLKGSEAHYRELAESISDVFFAFDEDLRYTYWNEASEKLTGVPAKDALGKDLYDIFSDSEQTREAEEVYKKALKTKQPQQVVNEYQLEGKDFFFEISAYPSKSGLSVFVKDITEQKRAEKAVQDTAARLHQIVTKNADSMLIVNKRGIVRFANPAAEALFERRAEELLGKELGFPVVAGETAELDIIRRGKETAVAEMRVVETEWEGESAYLASLRDITERKQAQQAQEKLNQQLQVKVSELEAFSYGIAHDLRSPLISIEGFSRELREDMLNMETERVQEDIRLLESGVRKMQDFLNHTLEYSRAGQLIKRTRNVSFSKIVNEVMTEFNGQISSIGATVSLADTFPKVYADRMRIKQVLANLIQNSIKYRDKTVPLKIKIGHQLSKGEVVFFVRDNGLGIDASETEKVFALFYRGTAGGEGSGIGLPVVKKIIEAHGGRIWIESQSGKGTAMYFTLPKQSGTNKEDDNGKD